MSVQQMYLIYFVWQVLFDFQEHLRKRSCADARQTHRKKRLIWNEWFQSRQTPHYCRFQQLEQQQKAAAGHPAILLPPEFKQSFLCISSQSCWEDGYPALRHASMDSSYVSMMLVRFLFWPRKLKGSSKGKSGREQGLERKEVH